MGEPLKERFNAELVQAMARHISQAGGSDFLERRFLEIALDGLESLEMKQRAVVIREALREALPSEFQEAARILVDSLGLPLEDAKIDRDDMEVGLGGWAIWPLADYVACYGQDDLETSLPALREMTMRFTAEFAIRPFLQNHSEETLAVVRKWARDPNQHVRRLASEGTRPRLPWGLKLQHFDRDPTAGLEILELLKNDEAAYVRLSVANHLNDISKRHPELIVQSAKRWMREASPEREKLVRHGCRTLLKAGHPGALAVFGYGTPAVKVAEFRVEPHAIEVGESVALLARLQSLSDAEQALMVDFVVHYQRANGSTNGKVFKWTKLALLPEGEKELRKMVSFKLVTTRRFYPGTHRVELQVNGEVLAEGDFELL